MGAPPNRIDFVNIQMIPPMVHYKSKKTDWIPWKIEDLFLLPLIRVQVAVSVMVLQVTLTAWAMEALLEAMAMLIKLLLSGMLLRARMRKVLSHIHTLIDLFKEKQL
jgi:hypothetical protein